MVPWTHLREPRLGRLSTDLTSEFTVFNLVIRLSKVKQPAFFQVSHRRSMCWTTCRCAWLQFLFALHHWQPYETSIFHLCSRDWPQSQHYMNRHQDTPSGVVLLPFWYFRWGKPVVHPIRENLTAVLYPMWVDRPRSCNGNNVRLS